MIRLILTGLLLLVFFILSIPILLVEWLIGKRFPKARDISSLRIVQFVLRIILWLSGSHVNVIGKDNIPKDQAVLYIVNHRSIFDVVLTYPNCPGLTGYIAKIELMKIPFLSHWMKRLYCLFLDRQDIKAGLKTILTAIDYVKSGISIVIFPEGTRGKDSNECNMLPFHEGSFKIATKTGCPIIPVTLNHTSEIFEDHFPWIRKTEVTIEYGTPIDPKALTLEQKKFIGKYVQSVMQEMLQKNH